VGEPGLPGDPREEERRWVRRRSQARLSALDRWPRWVAVTPAKEWTRPAQKAEDFAALASYRASVVFYAVVSDEIEQVIEFFRTPAEAEAMLEPVLEVRAALARPALRRAGRARDEWTELACNAPHLCGDLQVCASHSPTG
jgi:hypothetical protein